MYFDFNDLTDDQINEYKNPNFLVKAEECDFKVLESTPHTSKTGNKSIKLLIEITDSTGKKAKVYDYLTVGEKLIRFLTFFGFEEDIANRRVDFKKLVGVTGRLKNNHRDNERSGEKENAIHYYINPNAKKKESVDNNVSRETSKDEFHDDDIPF